MSHFLLRINIGFHVSNKKAYSAPRTLDRLGMKTKKNKKISKAKKNEKSGVEI